MWFRKKKNEADTPLYPYGFAVPEQPQTSCSQKVLVCLIKGLLIFTASYGTVGGVISSFNLPCYQSILLIVFLLFSILMAFLHYSRLIFNLFYPVIFVGFTYFIFTFRFMVNSGYQAFINILQQSYGDYYTLDVYRESTEFFSNRTMTITYAAGFIGFFLILLLNIFISEYMSVLAVILMTFPLFQLGIFVEKMPAVGYFILLLFSYFMVAILRSGRHFLLPYRDKKWTEFRHNEDDLSISYTYHASGKVFLQLTGLFLVFAIVIGLAALPLMSGQSNNRLSAARRRADDYMKNFTQTGLSAFFDRYPAKGGISGGQLGGVSAVRPDYQTDLTVTFVPYSYDTLYLKAYTGSNYTGHSWEVPDFKDAALRSQLGDDYENYEEFTAVIEGHRLNALKQQDPSIMSGLMRIENLDAEAGYFYLPYFVSPDMELPHSSAHSILSPSQGGAVTTTFLEDNLTGLAPSTQAQDTPSGGTYAFSYFPYHEDEISVFQADDADHEGTVSGTQSDYAHYYDMLCNLYYLDIPESLREYLMSLHAEIGTGKDREEQIELIRTYLHQFPYSMTPGTTPMDADFIRYFLESQKRGYCSHFASAAVMLLRSYGIPARYVEGYAVSLSDIVEGSDIDADYDTWFSGENPLGKTGVVTVNVSDGSAHAWVEIYEDGFGWVPLEFTPPSDETDTAANVSGFWDLFSGLFGLAGNSPDTVDNQSQTNELLEEGSKSINSMLSTSVFRPLILFIGLIAAILLVYALVKYLIWLISMMAAWNKGDHSVRISYHYKKLTTLMIRKNVLSKEQKFLLPTDFTSVWTAYMKAKSAATANTVTMPFNAETTGLQPDTHTAQMSDLLLACLFSEKGIEKSQAQTLLTFLKQCRKQL
ncbi:MAG: transglutaminase-like domain-containing protein [Lachnospiraceae bacterium]|nr:transglutaminase-like domain-containing protein [Lachnospiraceae bacterium]